MIVKGKGYTVEISNLFQKYFWHLPYWSCSPALHLNPPLPWAGGSGMARARQMRTRIGFSRVVIIDVIITVIITNISILLQGLEDTELNWVALAIISDYVCCLSNGLGTELLRYNIAAETNISTREYLKFFHSMVLCEEEEDREVWFYVNIGLKNCRTISTFTYHRFFILLLERDGYV